MCGPIRKRVILRLINKIDEPVDFHRRNGEGGGVRSLYVTPDLSCEREGAGVTWANVIDGMEKTKMKTLVHGLLAG